MCGDAAADLECACQPLPPPTTANGADNLDCSNAAAADQQQQQQQEQQAATTTSSTDSSYKHHQQSQKNHNTTTTPHRTCVCLRLVGGCVRFGT
jgi:hypothetical protein